MILTSIAYIVQWDNIPCKYTLLEERVPRGTLKGNSDCFIFGTLKGTSKYPMTGCFVKYPLMGFL